MKLSDYDEALNNQLLREKKYDEWIEKNHSLVFYFANKYYNYLKDLDETISHVYFALTKAFKHFDFNKDIKFVTYFDRIVINELLMELRRRKKHECVAFSIHEPMYTDSSGNELLLLDMIKDENVNIEDGYERKEERDIFYKHIENLEGVEKKVMELDLKGTKQRVISKKLKISQSYVSRVKIRAIQKIQKNIASKERIIQPQIINYKESKKKEGVKMIEPIKKDLTGGDSFINPALKEQKEPISFPTRTQKLLSLKAFDVKGICNYKITKDTVFINDTPIPIKQWLLFMKEIQEINNCLDQLQKEELILS